MKRTADYLHGYIDAAILSYELGCGDINKDLDLEYTVRPNKNNTGFEVEFEYTDLANTKPEYEADPTKQSPLLKATETFYIFENERINKVFGYVEDILNKITTLSSVGVS